MQHSGTLRIGVCIKNILRPVVVVKDNGANLARMRLPQIAVFLPQKIDRSLIRAPVIPW